MKKLCIILMIHSVLLLFAPSVLAQEYAADQCGEDAYWSFADGTLTITGTGLVSTNHNPTWAEHIDQIQKIVVEEGITALGPFVFLGHETVTEVQLPDSLTSIGGQCFQGCDELTSFTIPKGVTELGVGSGTDSAASVFSGERLTQILVDEENTRFYSVDGVLFDREEKALLCYPQGKTAESYTVPDGIEKISQSALWFSVLTHINLPDSLISIESGAFSSCKALTQVELPANLQKLETDVFAECDSLTEIIIYSKDCLIPGLRSSLGENAVLYGYSGSTTQDYAARYGKAFYDLESGEQLVKTATNADYLALLPQTEGSSAPAVLGSSIYSYQDREIAGYSVCSFREKDTTNETYQQILASAQDLTRDCATQYEKANAVCSWVNNYITYSPLGYYSYLSVEDIYDLWNNPVSNHYGYTHLCNFILYLLDIQTACVTCQDVTFTAAYLDGEWVLMDAANQNFDPDPSEMPDIKTMVLTVDEVLTIVIDDLSDIKLSDCDYSETAEVTVPDYVSFIYDTAFLMEDENEPSIADLVIKGTIDSYTETYILKNLKDHTIYHKDGQFIATTGQAPEGSEENSDPPTPAEPNGQCGDDAYWYYNEEYAILTIKGTGEMWNYDNRNNKAPWMEYYRSVEKLVIDEGITTAGSYAFYNMGMQKVDLPSTLTTIAAGSFCQSSVCNIEIPDSVTSIESNAFSFCYSLKSLVIPDSVTTIADWAFAVSGLESIVIPDSVTYVGSWAFNECRDLKTITLSKNLESISGSAFRYCDVLTQIQVEEGSTHLKVENGVLFDADGTTLIRVQSNLSGVYRIPDGVTEIDSYAFEGSNVSEVILPDGVTVLNNNVFEGCTELTDVVLPKSLEIISYNAFQNTSITRLVIPENVAIMQDSILSGCSNLEALFFLGDEPYDDSVYTMYNAPENLTIYYNAESQGWDDTWRGYPTQAIDLSMTVTATCTEGGIQTITCEALNLEYTRTVQPLGHDMSLWNATKAPTVASKGQWSIECGRCGYTQTQEIPTLVCENQTTVITNNIGDQNYAVRTEVICSYLVKNDAGYQRIEYTGEYVTIEQYDESFQLLAQKGICAELSLFGGFYTDGTYNFLVFGQPNPDENNDVEVIRLVRYDLDWNRMDSASVHGSTIWLPFDAGSLRMVHNGDYLYIRTCDEGYALSDGNHHQSSRQLFVHIPTMEFIYTDMLDFVSHSFNQFILCDEEKLVYMDHGDAGNARGAILKVWDDNTQLFEDVRIIAAHGKSGENATGVSMGGLASSESAYLTAGNSIVQDGTVDFYGQRNIFVTATPRQAPSTENTTTVWLTDYSEGDDVNVSTPHLVKLSDQKLVIMWTEGKDLCYAFLNAGGKLISRIYSCAADLSDCVPILSEGKLIWYVTDGTVLTFYQLDPSAPEVVHTTTITTEETQEPDVPTEPATKVEFTDVPKGAYYEAAVNWAVEKEITKGLTATTFGPEDKCTRGQIVTFLWRAANCPEPSSMVNPFVDVKETDYFYKAVMWAVEKEITKGIDATHFGPEKECTRAQVATFLWRAQNKPAPAGTGESFSDVPAKSWYTDAVAWAVENGITKGVGGGRFGPEDTCTRGQIVTFLYRAIA